MHIYRLTHKKFPLSQTDSFPIIEMLMEEVAFTNVSEKIVKS